MRSTPPTARLLFGGVSVFGGNTSVRSAALGMPSPVIRLRHRDGSRTVRMLSLVLILMRQSTS